MFLKRLKVRNFKSFAGATEIPFQNGFTGIAGPNGMGKSNISDAILFVLGPTSSKALRADRLTHLFFNGGASKKPATETEVGLVFDNRDRVLPVDTDEVELTRYVKLAPSDPDGYYSYFYVNGRRTTQGDIDSLLAHARLSGDGYNLVQQGDVNRIVSMGPVPRRGLVERVAGIAQYDEELQRADSKRSDLESNLTQIQTLLAEIRTHLGSLESQRLQAIQYKQAQDERRHVEARLARAGHQFAQQEVTSCEAQLRRIGGEIEKLRADAARLESARDDLSEQIERLEHEIARRGGPEAERFKSEMDTKRMAFARLDEQIKGLEEDLENLGTQIAEIQERIRTTESSIARLKKEGKALAEKLAAVESKATETSAALSQATGSAEQSHGKLVHLRKRVLEHEAKQAARRQAWTAAVQALESARAAVQGFDRELAQAEDEQQTRQLEVREIELRLRQSKKESPGGETSTATLQSQFTEAQTRQKALSERVERLARELQELNRQYLALDARLKARSEAGGRSGSVAAVEFLLSQRNLGKISGIRGTVEELGTYESEHRVALTVAGGSRFQSLVVETDEVADQCIRLLRAEKRGRATFLPLNRMLPGRPKGKALISSKAAGSVGFAMDLVQFEEELRPAFWYVFGETVVMENLAQARSQMGGVRLVTLEGDLIEATGAITGGSLDSGARSPGGDPATELRRLGGELRRTSEAESGARRGLTEASEQVNRLATELTRRSAQAEATGSALKLLATELDTARERLKHAERRVSAAESARTSAREQLQRAEAAHAQLEEELGTLQSEQAHLQEEYLAQMPGAVSGRIRALQESAHAISEERLAVSTQLEGIRRSLESESSALAEETADLKKLETDRSEKGKQANGLRRSRDSAQGELESLKAVEANQLRAVESQAEGKRRLEENRLKLVDQIARAQEGLTTRSALQQQEEVRLASAQQKLAEIEAAVAALPEPAADEPQVPVEELKRSLSTLTAQLDSMGDVNLRALEEYDQEKARLDEFEGEANRLTAEKTELLTLVHEIEAKKREKLGQVVEAVNIGFREIYSDLSTGGEGELALENPDDPLAGGLLIRARPVGKNVQRLEQLSGGEKSLASLAFIFALQKYDPSPLYVFDEVDMSLDGVNAENVGRLLRRNAERAQFIVISLRKVTLKFAHRLFGVTMHGDGCSRVVGLNLEEIVDVDERDRPAPRAVVAPEAAA